MCMWVSCFLFFYIVVGGRVPFWDCLKETQRDNHNVWGGEDTSVYYFSICIWIFAHVYIYIYISIQMYIYIYISIYTGGVGHWPQAIKCSGAAFLPQRLENQRRLLPPIFWSPKQIDPSAHTMALEGGWRGFAVEFASTRCLGNDILGGLYVSATCYGLPLLLP